MSLIPTFLLALAFAAEPTFQATTLDGRKVTLPAPGKATCLLFVGIECPISNRLAPEMARVVRDHSGIAFYYVYPDNGATASLIQKHRKEFGLEGSAIADRNFRVARFAKVTVTPEAAVFDTKGRPYYRGRINDLFSEHNVTAGGPVKHDLREALAALSAGLEVPSPYVAPVGCPIPFP